MNEFDFGHAFESAGIAACIADVDHGVWHAHSKVEVYNGDIDRFRLLYGKDLGEARFFQDIKKIDEFEKDGNLLVTAGITQLWNLLIGANSNTYSNANGALGVGDSSTAAAIGQTNLQAGTNAFRQAFDATYPTVATNVITCKATFGTSNANFSWAEWAVFNSIGSGSPPTGGTMLNRVVTSLGTKTSAASWALTITITIS